MRRAIAPLLLLVLALASGCSSDEDTSRGRGHVEKGDLFGSCRAGQDTACGSVASGGNCWCDTTCNKFGDCCADRNPVCGKPEPSACDGLNSEKCEQTPGCKAILVPACPLCEGGQLVCVADVSPCEGLDENACAANAMCALELVPACPTCDGGTIQCVPAAPGEATRCGGLAGLQCEGDQWCDFDESTGGVCGIADQLGICRAKPEACLEVLQPVCGCDGITHGNRCVANQNGVDAVDGACAN